jgi:hypothetical protein
MCKLKSLFDGLTFRLMPYSLKTPSLHKATETIYLNRTLTEPNAWLNGGVTLAAFLHAKQRRKGANVTESV